MTDPARVVATGTFDLLHPGHVHYLREAATMGEELHCIVAHGEGRTHKPEPVLPGEQRRSLVAALDPVDRAHLGHPTDPSVPIERIDPDVVVLGHDQHHDEQEVAAALAEWGFDCTVRRTSALEPTGDEVLSSSGIVDCALDARRRPSTHRIR